MQLDAYCRISQDKTGAGVSVANQLSAIREWADRNGHTIRTVYTDNDLSATSGKRRPGFEALLSAAPEAIVVWHQDRLLRVSRDLEKVLDTGMTVYQVQAGPLDLATAQGRAVARTVSAWSTYEVEQKADRQKLKNKAEAEAGKPYWRAGIRPFGHQMDGTLHPEEAPALRAAVERVLDGAAVMTVCRDLNAAGLKTNRGNDWHSTSLKRVLTSPRIAGLREYEGEQFRGAWEPVVDPDTWRALVLTLQTRERPRKAKERENPLSGIASCGTCGGSIGQSRGSSRLWSVASYRCSVGKHNARNADKTDLAVEDMVLALITVRGAEQVMGGSGADLAGLRRKRAEEVAWWAEQLQEAQRSRVPLSDVAVYRNGHEERLREIDAEILKAESDSLFSEIWREVAYFDPSREDEARAVWRALPLERKRRIIRALFREIVLLPGKRGQHFDGSPVRVELTAEGEELRRLSLQEMLRNVTSDVLSGPSEPLEA